MKSKIRILCKSILLMSIEICSIANAENTAPVKPTFGNASTGTNFQNQQSQPIQPGLTINATPPAPIGGIAPMVPPVSNEQTEKTKVKETSVYKMSESVREMLEIDIKAALANERNKYGIKDPAEVAKEEKKTEVKVKEKKPADTIDIRALYGIGQDLKAEVLINGSPFTYRSGESLPVNSAGTKSKNSLWLLVKIEGECLYLVRPHEKKSREVCYSPK